MFYEKTHLTKMKLDSDYDLRFSERTDFDVCPFVAHIV